MLGRRKQKSKAAPPTPSQGLFWLPRIVSDSGVFFTDRGESYIFAALLKSLAEYTGKPVAPLALQHADTAVNEYVRNYGMVIAMIDHEGHKLIISERQSPRLPVPFQDRIRSALQIMPDDTVLFSNDVFATPQPASAREVVYGERPQKPPKGPTRKETEKKWSHPEGLSPDEMAYLTGKSKKPPTT